MDLLEKLQEKDKSNSKKGAFLYCFNQEKQLSVMILDVTNTPWKEKHQYVLNCDPAVQTQRIKFNKDMHVSPFNAMELQYEVASLHKDEKIVFHMENRRLDNLKEIEFDATLNLKRVEIGRFSLTKTILGYPAMTFKVAAAIYWQALKLFIKKVPLHVHPNKTNGSAG